MVVTILTVMEIRPMSIGLCVTANRLYNQTTEAMGHSSLTYLRGLEIAELKEEDMPISLKANKHYFI
tara:strand:- start:204 stop:404 length:201 start_codon:yes stop_codon:yes gene_type:complete